MKMLRLPLPLLLSACATTGSPTSSPPNMVVAYRDLALDTVAGRARLARRIEQVARSFCAAYDPNDDTAIFDVRLANTRSCPSAAALMLANRMPPAVRRAYHAGIAAE